MSASGLRAQQHAYEHHRGASVQPLPAGYRPRAPQATALYRVVAGHLETMLADACARSDHGFGLPRFVERTFYRYLDCGVLARGFCRVRCETPGCGYELLLPFSCKQRGVCPSCDGRRMADTAAHLVDRVLPTVPHRQWTLSFPRSIRFQLARNGKLLSDVVSAFLRTVFAWQRRQARKRGIADGKTGAVTFVQRMGSFANLNVHFHATLPDGVFAVGQDGAATFVPLDPPSDEDVANLTTQIIRRVVKLVARHEAGADPEPVADALGSAQAASVQSTQRITARRDDRRTGHARDAAATGTRPTRCAFIEGFSLHANVRTHANDRLGLERLLRYGGRPPIAADRLSLADDGRVCYRFRRPAPSGVTEWQGSPVDFLARLATLIPPPRQHSVRYHGVFAPNAKLRSAVVPRAPAESASEPGPSHAAAIPDPVPATILARRLDWAALLARVFHTDVTRCPSCSGRLRVLSFITEPNVVSRILDHLRLPAATTDIAPARAPPQTSFDDDAPGCW